MKSVTGFLSILFALSTSSAVAEPMVIYAQVGSTVTLPREHWVTSTPYVKWYFGELLVMQINSFGRVISDETTFKDRVSLSSKFSLTIKDIKLEEFKLFRCELESTNPKKTEHFTYSLYTVSVTKLGSPVLAGETIELKCEVGKMFKGVQLRWQRPQKQDLTADTRIQSTNDGKLTVNPVTAEDHGEWTCVVTYQERQAHASTQITVIDFSPVPPQPLYTSNSSPLHLPCSFPPHVSWSNLKDKGIQNVQWAFTSSQGGGSGTKDILVTLSLNPKLSWNNNQSKNLDVSAVEKSDLDLSLGINRVTEADRGTYTCILVFNSRTLQKEIHVEVLNLVASPGSEVFLGQQVNLTCSLGHPLTDDLKLKWIRPTFPSKEHKDSSIFPIPEAREGDSGRWRCELWRNNTKLVSKDLYLKIVAEPMVIYAQVGSTVTLPRKHWVTSTPYVKWYFGELLVMQINAFGRVIKDETTFKKRVFLSDKDSLTIKDIKLEEFKLFRCELESTSPKMTEHFTYSLYTVSVTKLGSPVLAGETIELKCEVGKMFKGVQLRWQRPQKQDLTADTRIQSTNDGKLTVNSVTAEDHGEWTCVVTYQDRQAHASTQITVIGRA
ncbi:hypothetical protein UPYG_G00145840 [Umbra pygmaea]|uniref:Ig-like domain-containing protein n=1 Tax=Umbra pygmaea TaxID=75934 RepID=A0ABD0WW85_UMBPY